MSENAASEGSSKLLHELALRLAQSGCSPLWAVIDPALFNPLESKLDQREVIPIPVRYADLQPHKRPFLVRLGEPGRDKLTDDLLCLSRDEALRQQRKEGGPKVRSVCAYLVMDGKPASLAQHLSRASIFRWEGQARLFRLWDPRVMDLLAYLLDEKQKSDLLASAREWWWLGRDGKIQSLTQDWGASGAPQSFALHAEQVRYLQLSEAINGALDIMQDMGVPIDETLLPKRVGALLERGVVEWRLKSTVDRVKYALHALLVRADFDTISPVRDAMKRELEKSGAAMLALEKYSDEDWARMKIQTYEAAPDTTGTRKERHG